jgi:superfamily II DNA or RNA helicase
VTDTLYITKVNEVFFRIETESSVKQELSDYFTFLVPGASFMPSVRNKYWDGKIRLYNFVTGLIYCGLIRQIYRFAERKGYKIELLSDNIIPRTPKNDVELNLTLTPRDYQIMAYEYGVENHRAVFVSPTASGKSLIIFMLAQYHMRHDRNILVIVPTTSLVFQMKTDFEKYTTESLDIHCISEGAKKETDSSLVISTWQSIYNMPKTWYDRFDVIMGDEAHQYKAKSLTTIMERASQTKYRYGFTGTLDGTLTNKMVLEGLFGPVKKVTTTTELMERNEVAQLTIKCLVLKYPAEVCKLASKYSYQEEVEYLVLNERRNDFIAKLTLSLQGNSLLLFQFVEKHGQVLFDNLKKAEPERSIYFIHGGVDAEEREEVRRIVESENNAIIVASYGTFSTGINIRNLHNVLFSSPTKSRVRTLQSIGRGLRTSETKTSMTLYDISDDMRYKDKLNFTAQHFKDRIVIYNSENFKHKVYEIDLT